jgi:hypothetical protein
MIGAPRMSLTRLTATAVLLTMTCADASAQELEPGTYQNAPVAMNVVIVGYGFSTGNVLFDAALPIEGATAEIHTLPFGYLRTLRVFGRSGKLDVQIPVSSAHFEGVVAGEFRTRSPRGLVDPRVRFAVNLFGAPALDARDFAAYRQRTIIGAAIQLTLPLGQYDADRAVNLGAHRWAFRPELGVSHAAGRWILEAAGGAWFFTDNTNYFGGRTQAQAPLPFVKGNVIYSFRRNLWTSISLGFANGGETRLDGALQNNLQRNTRFGATLALPAGRSGGLRAVFTTGLTTRLGADFDSIALTYQYSWLGRRP